LEKILGNNSRNPEVQANQRDMGEISGDLPQSFNISNFEFVVFARNDVAKQSCDCFAALAMTVLRSQ
jgi:hypothetical protein